MKNPFLNLVNTFTIILIILSSQNRSIAQKVPLTASQDVQQQDFVNYIESEMKKLELKYIDMKSKGINDFPELRQEFERLRTIDPYTRTIPGDAREIANQKVAQQLEVQSQKNQLLGNAIPNVGWKERGPNNIGGRTRAIMFDPNDPTKHKLWAGGVSGGLWSLDDYTNPLINWHKVDDFWDNLAVSSIAYDPSNPNIFYVGTGENNGNYLSGVGGGIWKTIDGGNSWNRLSSTIPDYRASNSTIPGAMIRINKIVVSSNGTVFVATVGGILKSTDGGTSWTFALPYASVNYYYAYDIEIMTDGKLIAGFGGSRIYKSTDATGNFWNYITPNFISNSYSQVELAISSSGQIVYALGTGGWLIKSTDGGSSWVNLSVSNIQFYQAGYNFVMEVHPTDPNKVYIGMGTYSRSFDGGNTWVNSNYGDMGHPDQHVLLFSPNNPNDVIIGNDGGIYYTNQMNNSNVISPSTTNLNRGYNTTQFYSVAQKNIANDNYILGGTQDNGTFKLETKLPKTGSGTTITGGDGMLCFIDQDEPNIQIVSSQYNSHYLYNPQTNNIFYLNAGNSGYFVNPCDYDSRNNTFYAYGGNTTINNTSYPQLAIVKNIGTTNTPTFFTLPNTISFSCIKVAKTPNTVLIGSSNKIYRISNTNTNPIITEINIPNNNYIYITGIEIGETDNEIIVITSSNYGYGAKSVFYTNDGGITWTSKDDANHGLPDVPIRDALFNPNNTKQVLLATENGIWSTNDITAANPAWEISSTGLAFVPCFALEYRTSDGTVVVGTHGRGIFTSDVFTMTTPASIAITNQFSSPNICRGKKMTISFSSTNSFDTNNIFTVQLSDATGSFSNPLIVGTGNTNPVNITIPNAVTDGNGYKMRIVSTSPALISPVTPTNFIIDSSNIPFTAGMPALVETSDFGFMAKSSLSQQGRAYFVVLPDGAIPPVSINIVEGLNNDNKPALKSGFIASNSPQSVGNTIVTGLNANTNYDVFFTTTGTGYCPSNDVQKIDVNTLGSALAYCMPTTATGCSGGDQIESFSIQNTTLSNLQSGCSVGSYANYNSSAHNVVAGSNYTFNYQALTQSNGSFFPQNIAIWLDVNQNGVFDTNEMLFQSTTASKIITGNITIPSSASSGLIKLRIRSRYSGLVSSPCTVYSFGETEDYVMNIIQTQPIQSIVSGDWNNPATWSCNCITTVLDDVKVNVNHEVNVTTTSFAKNLEAKGKVIQLNNSKVKLTF